MPVVWSWSPPDLHRDAHPEGDIVNRADGGFYPTVFALATASLLGYALVLMVLPFAGPIVWALLLAFLSTP
jgi:hypothetical protein